MTLHSLIAAERWRERRRLRQAGLCAALVAIASLLLLALSGWFLTAAALAGGAGIVAAQAFNYMLPSAMIRLLAIVRTGARYGERLASHSAAFGALARLRPALYRALTVAPPSVALALGRGEATARLIGDVDAVEWRFVRLSGPWGVAAALASGAALTLLGGWLAMVATLVCVGGALGLARAWADQLEQPGRAVQRAMGALREEMATIGGAAAELRCFALEDWATARIAAASDRLAEAQARQAAVAARFEALHAISVALAAASALVLSAGAGAPIAALVTLAAAMTADATVPILRAMTERGRLREAEARLETLFASAEARPAADEACDATLMIEGTRFAPGNRIALTGPSGCGKTTMVEGLLGLRPLPPGRIVIGGRDVASIAPEALRATFAWAPQDAALLAGTVRDNLRLADDRAGEDRLWQALHDAALDDVVRALPEGLGTRLGEDGARLSGGERRRLSLARAYLAEAPWLLLDEPGEGLDAAVAAQVARRLDARLKRTGQGMILVSHRPVLSALCDRQWVADAASRRSAA
ncbi:ATP-binding cassette domain-containing protein [Sphingomonas sanguinis]|uniref:ATP-binding cassette domain-containing protein n=1 Tax=Sphingomonas sanguinis TaxID=33051 RepID=A0ABU5LN55_9SPHN|nr:ATP-binding cassette domain-containing protein [Sphingomonas sanguinis]MDZ7281374.1 ATP-binding cassette domain-containing protein [Sphingomonas sanguinis]QXT34416.1 ATP-binding cassette domain-containing protein [Sphingomonas sanguinis]